MGVLDSKPGGSLLTGNFDQIIGGLLPGRQAKGVIPANDFPGGLIIVEIVDGRPRTEDAVVLQGNFMPNEAFKHGGTQKIVKDYYPGNAEPVTQVLGPQEDNITVRGKFKTKRFKDNALRLAAREYSELVDAMRRRGNLVRITLGEFKRYGYIERSSFEFMRLQEISYEIEFSIVGLSMPSNTKQLEGDDQDINRPNKELTAAAAAAVATYKNYPDSMPRTLSEFLNDQISTVAEAIGLVTGFIDNVFNTAENLEASAGRAVGLIKNARTKIAVYQRRVGALDYGLTNLAGGVSAAGKGTAYKYLNANHLFKSQSAMLSLSQQLAALQKRFEALARTVPFRRHLVRQGDSLQKLAVIYYGDAELWKRIYDHNKLTSTALDRGKVLEIPRR